MIVPSEIGAVEVLAHEARIGRYLEIRQGAQSVAIETGALSALVAALCLGAREQTIALEIGDRQLVIPGVLGLPPGKYRARIIID